MNKVDFKFSLGETVVSPIGPYVITMRGENASGIWYHINAGSDEDWFEEKDLEKIH